MWTALSDLFVDTAIDDAAYHHIAETIRKAGYSIKEARRILDDEVFPAFAPNLLGVAGEWAGWSAETVEQIVLDYHSDRPLRKIRRWLFFHPLLRRRIRAGWAEVEKLLR